MKLELTTYGKKISLETQHDDVSVEEYFDAFKTLLIGATFSEKTINEFIIELAEELKE